MKSPRQNKWHCFRMTVKNCPYWPARSSGCSWTKLNCAVHGNGETFWIQPGQTFGLRSGGCGISIDAGRFSRGLRSISWKHKRYRDTGGISGSDRKTVWEILPSWKRGFNEPGSWIAVSQQRIRWKRCVLEGLIIWSAPPRDI